MKYREWDCWEFKNCRIWLSFYPPLFPRYPCTQASGQNPWPFCQSCRLSGRFPSLSFMEFWFCSFSSALGWGLWLRRFCPSCWEFQWWQSWFEACFIRLAPFRATRTHCCHLRHWSRLGMTLYQRSVSSQRIRRHHRFKLIGWRRVWVVFRLGIRRFFRFCLSWKTFSYQVCRRAWGWRVGWI